MIIIRRIAKNLINFRFEIYILTASTQLRVKCSKYNFQIARFKAEQVKLFTRLTRLISIVSKPIKL